MISVCIATYNSSRFIQIQIESIQPQLGKDDEIVISDDSSTDDTLPIIRSLNDERIKIIKNSNARGYTGNFENALNHASGDYIFLSDHDDIWEPKKVVRTLEILQNSDFVVSNCSIINEVGERLSDSYFKIRKPRKTAIGNIIKFGYLGCCFAFRRRILNKALPFPENRKLCTHDNWLCLVAFAFYRVTVTDEKLIQYRRHRNNASMGGLKPTTSFCFKIKYRAYLIFNLMIRRFGNSTKKAAS